jgi:hypothetical protein
LGNAQSGPGERGWRFLYFNPLGRAQAGTSLDTQMESIPIYIGGSWWSGSAAVESTAGIQYVPTGTAQGNLDFWIGPRTFASGSSAHGRILESTGFTKGFQITNSGPKIPTGKVLTFADGTSMATAAAGGTVAVNLGGTGTTTASLLPTGNWTLTQNSVPAIQSDESGAKSNSIRVTAGQVRVGTSGKTSGAAVPFEVAASTSGTMTLGEFYVDSSGVVRVGRLDSTSGTTSGRLIVQDRLGSSTWDFNAVSLNTTTTHTVTSSNVTDATSSTGSIRTSGGVSTAKGIYLGTVMTGTEQGSEPAAPAANGFVIFAVDNGGKTQLKVRFASGASQQIAIEP